MKDFNDINIVTQTRYKNKHNKKRSHYGLDTETYKGYVKLICDSEGRFKFIDEFEDLLQFLTYTPYGKSAFNWFFNLKFDFESIIKYLSLNELEELYETKHLEFYSYHLSYLPSKFFSIYVNKASYRFFDLNNFLETSLNNAAQKWLNRSKIDNVDASRLNVDWKYWEKNKRDIVKYCLMDAELTRDLAIYFFNLLENTVHFLPNKPYSKGAYSQEYFLHKCYIPTINDIKRDVLRYAYNSYSGGRFEILKRGYFNSCFTYDIKSAYPFIMANLIDMNRGKWYYVDEYDDNAYYGYYNCRINFFHNVVSPFMQKIEGLNVYPNGEFEQYLTQSEIKFIFERFNNVEINIIDGWVFHPQYELHPLQEEILNLYEWKEREKDKDIRQIVKIILNSLYGKFIQTIGEKSGKLFNPIWATEITSQTRLKLLDSALYDINNVIGFSTDSIHSIKPLNCDIGKELGQWELDFKGSGIFVMSDVYTVWNEEKEKTKLRGFKLNFSKDVKSLIDILHLIEKSEEYKYYISRPLHLGECLKCVNIRTKEDINIWSKVERRININGDNKRIWERPFKNGSECFVDNHSSIPLLIT